MACKGKWVESSRPPGIPNSKTMHNNDTVCALEAVEDVSMWLDSDIVSELDCMPARSRSGRVIKNKTKEWPPRCLSGFCDMRKGCVCTQSTTVAGDYFDCVVKIYGTNAPGVPDARPSAAGANAFTTPVRPPRLPTEGGPAPPAKRSLDQSSWSTEPTKPVKRQKPVRLALDCKEPDECAYTIGTFAAPWVHSPTTPSSAFVARDVETVVIDPNQAIATPEALMFLFDDIQQENNIPSNSTHSPASVVDLQCNENPVVAMGDAKKGVTWTGLPPNPPEWVSGPRQSVPKLWEPCSHVLVLDGLMCMHDRHAPKSSILTLPCWDVNPVWT